MKPLPLNRKQPLDKLTQENTDLKRSIALADKKTKLVAMGYDEKLADSTAIAMVDGDMDTVMKNQATFNESREKAIRAEQMKKTPRPAAGSDGTGGMDYAKKSERSAGKRRFDRSCLLYTSESAG